MTRALPERSILARDSKIDRLGLAYNRAMLEFFLVYPLRSDTVLSQPVLIPAAPTMEASWPAVVQAIAAVAAVFVTVVGFIFLWLQLQGLKKASQSDAHGRLYSGDAELMKLFVDRPHLRPYFYDNATIDERDPDSGTVYTIAEMFCVQIEHVMLQLDNLPTLVRQSWVDYARWLHRSSPAIRQHYAKMRKFNAYVTAMDEMTYGTGEMPKLSARKMRNASF